MNPCLDWVDRGINDNPRFSIVTIYGFDVPELRDRTASEYLITSIFSSAVLRGRIAHIKLSSTNLRKS